MTTLISNLHRAAHARAALAAFIEESQPSTPLDRMDRQELSDTIADLISDLLHLAGYAVLDPELVLAHAGRIVAQAKKNFHAELSEEA